MIEKIALWLYNQLPDTVVKNEGVRQDLKTLSPAGDIVKLQREFVIKKLTLCVTILVAGVVMSITLWITNINDAKIVDNRLVRNGYGDGTNDIELVADDGEESYSVTLNLEERQYSTDELSRLLEEALPILEEELLGDNESFERVEYDLRLVESLDGFPFDIEYIVPEEYIDYEGKLVNDTLETPVTVEITAKLVCGLFEAEHTMFMNVCSKAKQPSMAQIIEKKLAQYEGEDRESASFELPETLDGKALSWSYKRQYTGMLALTLVPLVIMVVFLSKDRDLHKCVQERDEQMEMDYPEIVSSLALLIGAGMTVPNAWRKIVQDYKKRKDETGISRYAYEEMLFTVYEMDNGVLQANAYERFGRRCRMSSYNRLATMLSQNIRKGAANLPMLLKAEADEAFQERKHLARKQGEKAGTKLLVPMIMLLAVAMVLITVPALNGYF